jgi:predicted NBD/HSP70 family sugar kinase
MRLYDTILLLASEETACRLDTLRKQIGIPMQIKPGLATPTTRTHPLRKSAQTELNVLKLIQARPSISRVELAKEARLSTAAITGIVNSLHERGLLVEGASSSAGVGRKRIGLWLRPELGYVVGVDLGTFNLRVAVTDVNGSPRAVRQVPTRMNLGRADVLKRCFATMREVLDEAGVDPAGILGVGVAFSGVIDVANGTVLSYPRPGLAEGWKNTPLRAIVEAEFGVPCVLEDSVRAVANSERITGAGRDFSDFVYVDVGMGVGAAIFINESLYRGCNGSAGEFGHMTVDEEGPLCCCGSYGCLEALASGACVIENVKLALAKGVSSKVLHLAGDVPDDITLEMIAEAAEDRDSLSFRALSEAATHIGAACADLVNLLNPEAIIFGGALFRASPALLLEHLSRMVRHRAMEKSANDVKLLLAVTKSDAGALGMASMIASQVVNGFLETAVNRHSPRGSALSAAHQT